MSASIPSGAGASDRQPANVQQLIGLLGNLMPLLVRFQSQAFAQFSGVNPDFSQQALEQQAATSFVNDITTLSLRNVSAYLENNAEQHTGLQSCLPLIAQAEHSLGTRDYAQAFDLIWQAYRMIAFLRATDQQIPPVRVEGDAGSTDSGRMTSSH